jgi:hypothetical protein
VDAWPNIVDENNHIYDMSVADLGLGTNPLDEAGADVFALWNRAEWGVPDAEKPTDYKAYYFGDYDPNTIPGKDTEDGSGIEKYSDLIEDFSYTADIKSKSDGLRIGALHWNDEAFDGDASLTAVKAAYEKAKTGVKNYKFTPVEFTLSQNYPNPFNPVTHIPFTLASKTHVKLSVYNQIGQTVATLVDEQRNAGSYKIAWDASSMPTGLYFYTIKVDDVELTRKMMLLK